MSKKNRRWPITTGRELSPAQRKAHWENSHAVLDYEDTWSLTEDPTVQRKVLHELKDLGKDSKILIAGCGSRTSLQQALIENTQDCTKIVCTDFPGVVAVAKRKYPSSRIEYIAKDSTKLGWKNKYDAVVISNSVVSDSDSENRSMISEFHKALKPGGVLVGFFPTILCTLDVAYTSGNEQLKKEIDMDGSSFYDPNQSISQVFYRPLHLRRIFKEAAFEIDRVEIFYCDTPHLKAETKKHYGIDDDDLVVYEHFVVAHKPR